MFVCVRIHLLISSREERERAKVNVLVCACIHLLISSREEREQR